MTAPTNEFSSAFSTAFDPAAVPGVPEACTWPLSFVGCDDCEESLTALDPADRAAIEAMAGDLLDAWTDGQFGACPITVRPCRTGCSSDTSTFWGRGPFPGESGGGWTPVLVGGRWFNIACGTCGMLCTCEPSPSVLVLPGPISSVSEVIIGGTVLPPSAYRVDNSRYLVRQDGGSWPACQDLDASLATVPPVGPDDPFTWAVTYVRGLPVPIGGQVAAGRLACELAKALCGDSSCQLPRRVQSITRQGVTMAILDTFDDVAKGRTGVWVIDSWVASVTRPIVRGGTVTSPDVRRRSANRTQTWP